MIDKQDTNANPPPPNASSFREHIRALAGRMRQIDAKVWGTLFLVLVTIFIWRQRTEVLNIIRVLRSADLRWTIALLIAAFGLHLTFTLTQSSLLRILGHRIPLGTALVTYAERQTVATVVPLGAGPSLIVLMQRFARFGVTNDDAVFSVVLFGIIGHASFATFLLPVLGWLIIDHAASSATILAATALVIVVVIAVGLLMALLSGRLLPAAITRRIPSRVEDFLASARTHHITLRSLAIPFGLSLLGDVVGVGCLSLALHAVGADASIPVAAAGYAVGTLFLLIAPIFQGLGVVELSMTLVLQQLGVPPAHALGATLLYRLGEAWLPVVIGIALQARHQKRIMGLPSRLPALWTGFNGVLSILSVMPHPIHRSLYQPHRHGAMIDQVGIYDLHNASRSITLAVGFLLILLSYGLWRRQRTAWWLAVVFTAVITLTHIGKGHDHLNAIVASINLVLLLLYGSRFRVRSDRPTLRRGITFFASTLLLALAYGVLSLWLIDRRQFGVDFSFTSATTQSLDLYFGLDSAGLAPRTVYAHWLVNSFHLIGALTIFVLAVSLIRPYVWRHRSRPIERERARALVTAYGDSSQDFFKYADDKQFFFSSAGYGVVAYGLSGHTALILGDPVARDADAFARTLDEFLEFADANGWHPAFHQATHLHLDAYRKAGLIALKIGAEAVVHIDDFTLTGNKMKSFRSVMNRYEREGYRAVFHEPPISGDLLQRLRDVSNEWLTLDGRRERGFTLGQFTDDYISSSTILTVESSDGRVEAFVNLIPDGVSGEITFDLMRHRADAPNGAMDFVLLNLIDYGRKRGAHRLSLGMVPFADVGTETEADFRERALALLTERFNRFFAAQSLWEYKDKFHPIWEPRYLIYTGDAWLPGIGLAIARLTEGPPISS